MKHPDRTMSAASTLLATCCSLLLGLGITARPSAAQSISGTLLDVENDQPIPLGLVLMFTEAGDSVGITVADGAGRFEISAPEPGSFVLLASALGYGETLAGVFELGEDGSMQIEYRLSPAPLPIDELVVELARPTLEHHLIRNGFVRRFQRGFGRFITPYDIERSVARSTEALMMGIPGVRVGPVREQGIASPHLGEVVEIARSTGGGWCKPTLYVDGVWTEYYPELGGTLSQYAHIGDIEAAEVYRRPLEVPAEYPQHYDARDCGVLVLWTKTGLAPGQGPTTATLSVTPGVPLPDLPFRPEHDVPLTEGERIRMEIAAPVAEARGLDTPWEGTFMAIAGDDLVAEDPVLGRASSVPLAAIQVLQVERPKGPGDAYRRGAIYGAAFSVGMYTMLRILCRGVCAPDAVSLVAPSLGTGLFVGVLVKMGGPGDEWVRTPVPGRAMPPSEPAAELSIRIPTRAP